MDIVIEMPGAWQDPPVGSFTTDGTVSVRGRDPGLRQIFEVAGAGRLEPDHLRSINAHTSIIRVTLPGGSREAARTMLRLGRDILRAGGIAVRVVSAGVAHSANDWSVLADSDSTDALFHAYVSMESTAHGPATRGMDTFGMRDARLVSPWSDHAVSTLTSFAMYCLSQSPALRDGDMFSVHPHRVIHRVATEELPAAPPPTQRWCLTPTDVMEVSGLAAGVTAIACGGSHCLALRSDGSVVAWGSNFHGERGDDHPGSDRAGPMPVVPLESDAMAISAGYNHSLALMRNGTVKAWGANYHGELGRGGGPNRCLPEQVDGLDDVIAISAGGNHNLALRADGAVLAWGWNTLGQLGDGTSVDRSRPVLVPGLETGVSAVAAGRFHSIALRGDGTVFVWGATGKSLLPSRLAPVSVAGITGVVALVGAGSHALTADGTVVAWDDSLRPVEPIAPAQSTRGLAAVEGRHFSLRADGSVVTWTADAEAAWAPFDGLPAGIVAIGSGISYGLALTTGGAVLAWGGNLNGELGLARHHRGDANWMPRPIRPARIAEMAALATSSIRIHSRGGGVQDGDQAGTRLGGRPSCPPDMSWPEKDGTPQMFVAQVDLALVAPLAPGRLLPPAGLLLFFCNSRWEFEGDEIGGEVVLVATGVALTALDFPPGLPAENQFREIPLRPRGEIMDAPLESWEVNNLSLTRDELRVFGEAEREEEAPAHRMFGYPNAIQDDPRHDDELLLLQVDSDDTAGMTWGDQGRIYYLIRPADLRARRFDRVRVVYQCH